MNKEDVAEFMRTESLILVTAESCTAGLIASTLAEVPGAGKLLDCAFVVYSPQAKEHILGVKPETIKRYNLTSEQVAREMALGALASSRANLSIANTGVADDSGDDVPAGTQCFAWAFESDGSSEPQVFAETRRFDGDRNAVRQASALYALQRIPHYYSVLDGAGAGRRRRHIVVR